MISSSLKKVGLSAAVVVTAAMMAAPGAYAADAVAGEKVFKRCKACHQVGPEAKNKVGPQLNGLVGRVAGSVEGFKYGTGLVEANGSGLVWDETNLGPYILNPRKFVQEFTGNKKAKAKMVAQRLKEKQLADVIAYLGTYGTDGATPTQ